MPWLAYAQPAALLEGNHRIDEAIRRVLNAGADVPAELVTSLTVEHGMDTYVIGGLEEPDALRWFASGVIPAVREGVAEAR